MADDDTPREEIHKPADAAHSAPTERAAAGGVPPSAASEAWSAGSRARWPTTRTGSRSCTSTGPQWHDVAAFLRDERAVHAVPRRHGGRPPRRQRAPRRAGREPGALRGGRELPLAPAQPAHPHDLRGAGRRPERRQPRRPLSRRELRRARGVRHVRHRVRRSPRPHAHPHARRLGGLSRCARTTHPAACPSRSRTTRPQGDSPRDSRRPSERPRAGYPRAASEAVEEALERQTDEGAQELRRARARSWSPAARGPKTTRR